MEKARIAKVAAIEAFEGYKNERERFRTVRTDTLHVGGDALAMISAIHQVAGERSARLPAYATHPHFYVNARFVTCHMLQAYGVDMEGLGAGDSRSGNSSGDDAGHGSDCWSGWESGDDEGAGKVAIVVHAPSKEYSISKAGRGLQVSSIPSRAWLLLKQAFGLHQY